MTEEKNKKIDFNNLKVLNVKKTKGKFKTFTNASLIPGSDFQPYLGKALAVNIDEILSVYPSEDEVGTSIHSISGQTWKVIEEINIVIERINE